MDKESSLDAGAILNSLESAILVIDRSGFLIYANNAAERLFENSCSQLMGLALEDLLPTDSPVTTLIRQTQKTAVNISEYGVRLGSPRIVDQLINIQISEIRELNGGVVVNIFPRLVADKIDRQLTHRDSMRSTRAMAEMLAHEVKNPLSGIRGAAQLLEQGLGVEDRNLTRLICDETDRICKLVDRIEILSDQSPLDRTAVNIHEVLDRVQKISNAGFAKEKKIIKNYDPSLPLVDGNFDQLVQIFLNLFKNASEASPVVGGKIDVTTSYQHGIRLIVPGQSSLSQLPLVITVQDNGSGIPDPLKDYIFDPFVTSKTGGSGLGLALTSKIVASHGGVIEFDSQPGKTKFRVFLPKVLDDKGY